LEPKTDFEELQGELVVFVVDVEVVEPSLEQKEHIRHCTSWDTLPEEEQSIDLEEVVEEQGDELEEQGEESLEDEVEQEDELVEEEVVDEQVELEELRPSCDRLHDEQHNDHDETCKQRNT